MIGARQQTSKGLRFESSDGKTKVFLELDEGRLQIEVNGDWLWLSSEEAEIVRLWLNRNKR